MSYSLGSAFGTTGIGVVSARNEVPAAATETGGSDEGGDGSIDRPSRSSSSSKSRAGAASRSGGGGWGDSGVYDSSSSTASQGRGSRVSDAGRSSRSSSSEEDSGGGSSSEGRSSRSPRSEGRSSRSPSSGDDSSDSSSSEGRSSRRSSSEGRSSGSSDGGSRSRGQGRGIGGAGGDRRRRMLADTSAAAAAACGTPGVVRKLLQLAGGVSTGSISTVGSGPAASLSQLDQLPTGSDFRAGASSKNLVLLHGVDWWGLLLLGFAVTVVLLYVLYHFWLKRRATARLRMAPCYSGALRLAAARGDVKVMQAVADGAPRFNPDADHEGFTALHAAAVEGNLVATLWLCQAGADVTALKDDGWQDTALHYAAARGHIEVCKVLLAYGSPVEATNYAGLTPAQTATRSGHTRVAEVLAGAAAGTQGCQFSPNNLPGPLCRKLAAEMSQYQQEVGNASAAAGASPALAAAAGATAPLHRSGERSKPVKPAAVMAAAAEAAACAVPADSTAAAAGLDASAVAAAAVAAAKKLASAAAKRGWEGVGSQGTELVQGTRVFRVLAVISQLTMAAYVVWRALRTLNPGINYLLSMPIWLCEFAGFTLSNAFMLSLWNQIHRPARKLSDMLPPEEMPAVDVYVPTYSELVEVIEPTVIAALNMTYPGCRLHVVVLDDGARPEAEAMVRRLRFQSLYMGREAKLSYLARKKVKGVPHHAKAGNINSALLKECDGSGTFVLVLDCDMIVHPDFLQNILGHFYKQDVPGGRWSLKDKAGFIQTPQDFWNVDATDPMVHSARFFYGPMLQGRDGIGACPCCGTGVVFRRDALVSLGGQSYGSITEDYNTAMNMLGSGFATMFLNERLVFGMAPDDLQAALTQRLRWAMGALQILSRTNPLTVPGLSTVQSLLFFEALAHHWLAVCTVILAMLPIPFLYTGYSPVVAPAMWEFTLAFGSFYFMNRVMLWWVHGHVEGGSQEMWRGSQMWVWISPNHIKAIWKVLVAENWLFKKLFAFEITFAVTSKDKGADGPGRWDALRSALAVTWPYLLWMAGFASGVVYFIVNAALGRYGGWETMVYFISMMWGVLVLLSIWPPVSVLLPREETEEGWKIKWDALLHLPSKEDRQAQRAALSGKNLHPKQLIQQQRQQRKAVDHHSSAAEGVGDAATAATAATAAASPDEEAMVAVWHDPDVSTQRDQQQRAAEGAAGAARRTASSKPPAGNAASGVRQHMSNQGLQLAELRGSVSSSHNAVSSPTAAPTSPLPCRSVDCGNFGFDRNRRSSLLGLSRLSRASGADASDLAMLNVNFLPLTGVDAIDAQLHPENYSQDNCAAAAAAAAAPTQAAATAAGRTDSVSWAGLLRRRSLLATAARSSCSPTAAGGRTADASTFTAGFGAVGSSINGAVDHRSGVPSADPQPRQQPPPLLHFSPAAETVRAVGPEAIGRIGLPGRAQAVRDAAALFTAQILPEPVTPPAAAPGTFGGASMLSARVLTVDTDGQLLPPGGSAAPAAWALADEAADAPSHTAAGAVSASASSAAADSSAGINSSANVSDNAAAVVVMIERGGSSGGADERQDNATVAMEIPVEVTYQPLQLQRLAAAVQEVDAAPGRQELPGWVLEAAAAAAGQNGYGTIDAGAAAGAGGSSAAAAGEGTAPAAQDAEQSAGAWQVHRSGALPASNSDINWGTGNWATKMDWGAESAAHSVASNMFSTRCAVIPTMPDCVYEHTIAAVPNFNERAAPKSSYMFFTVNFALLALLVAASFFEVYGAGSSLPKA